MTPTTRNIDEVFSAIIRRLERSGALADWHRVQHWDVARAMSSELNHPQDRAAVNAIPAADWGAAWTRFNVTYDQAFS